MIPFLVLAIFFAFSSFAFGCMEGWAIATCEVILFAGAAWAGWRDPEFWRWPKRLWFPALFVAVLAAIGILQLIPLPVSLWRSFHAERVAVYDEGAKAEALLHTPAYTQDPFAPAAPSIEGSSSPSNPPSLSSSNAEFKIQNLQWSPLTPPAPSWLPASFTPMATARAIVALLAALCLILLIERLSRDRVRMRHLMWIVGLLGLAVAFVALVQYEESQRLILGIRESRWAERAFGPFVNPNHGEAFVNLALPFLYYLLWRRSLRQERRENRWGLRVFMVGIFCMHVVLLAVSHSRGAYAALALYPLAILLHVGLRKRNPLALGAGVLYALSLAAAVGFVLYLGAVFGSGRIQLDENVPVRHLAVGQGLASFEARYPAVVTDFPLAYTTKINTHLENEYLQVFFEAGLVPMLLALFGAAWVFVMAYRSLKMAHTAFWLVPAFAAETIHASVDFIGHVFPIVGAFLLIWAVLARYDDGDNGNDEANGHRRHRHSREK